MGDYKIFAAASTIALTCFISTNCQTVLTRSAVGNALKDILSPSNNERAAQILRMAASRQRVPEAGLPIRTGMPKMGELVMPTRTVAREFTMPGRVAVPTQIVRPEAQQIQKVYQNVPISYGVQKEKVVHPSRSQVSFGSPYLPVASPVSAFVPATPNFLPMSQSSSQHLRKIPIPPPTL